MNRKEKTALEILKSTKVDMLEAAIIAKEVLIAGKGGLSRARKCISLGAQELRKHECTVSFRRASEAALEARKNRRSRTQIDFRYVLKKLIHCNPGIEKRRVRGITTQECWFYLSAAFPTPQQFRKGRAVLSGVFSTAIRQGWSDTNPVSMVECPMLHEHEINILTPHEITTLLETAERYEGGICFAAVGLMLYAGIRPHEVARLTYSSVDMAHGSIFIPPRHSKTGGARCIYMAPPLMRIMKKIGDMPRDKTICPKRWHHHWAALRTQAGWTKEKPWQPDILRHTFASYHLQHHHDYTALQWAMGHRDANLLRTRYVNMRDVGDTAQFWS